MIVVIYKGLIETAHQTVADSAVTNFVKMQEEAGFTCEVLTEEAYNKLKKKENEVPAEK